MVLLNSKFGILQSKVFQSGSSQPYIYPKDIRQFLVPEVNENLKKELYELIRSSYDAKIESQRLLEQAKTRVEELIEQSIEANA
jgi:type I restriction enzyme, S subunit